MASDEFFYFFDRHIASFLSVFKLVLIGLIIVGKDPFAFFGMQAPSIWQWGQENKVCNLIALAALKFLGCQ